MVSDNRVSHIAQGLSIRYTHLPQVKGEASLTTHEETALITGWMETPALTTSQPLDEGSFDHVIYCTLPQVRALLRYISGTTSDGFSRRHARSRFSLSLPADDLSNEKGACCRVCPACFALSMPRPRDKLLIVVAGGLGDEISSPGCNEEEVIAMRHDDLEQVAQTRDAACFSSKVGSLVRTFCS